MKTHICILLVLTALLAFAVYSLSRDGCSDTIGNAGSAPIFVIDPGHGGEDGGAVSAEGDLESVINLNVALRTDALLGLFGYPCVMTRYSEELSYPSGADTVRKRKQADLNRRVRLANETSNAVFLSIHQNKYTASGPKGAQVFYRDEPGSVLFSEAIQRMLTAGLGTTVRSPAVVSDSVFIMRSVRCPAVLVECGFLSNPQELNLLRSRDYQLKLALCLACGCAEYTLEWENMYGQDGEG